jgi:hypothetical protein
MANRVRGNLDDNDMPDSDDLTCLLLARLQRVYARAIAAGDLRAALRALNLEAKAQGLYRHAELQAEAEFAAELRAGAGPCSHRAQVRACEGQPQGTTTAALQAESDQEAA